MIYFIQAGESGPIKIGYSSDVAIRLGCMQSDNHELLRILGVIPCRKRGRRAKPTKEIKLHSMFAHLRIHREWFSSDPALVDYIAKNAMPFGREVAA